MDLLNSSSKSVYADKLIKRNLDVEYGIFGFFIQNLCDLLLLCYNFFYINGNELTFDHIILHMIFLLSPFLWLILFNLIINKKNTPLNIVIFALLFLNPLFIDFLHFAWRQSLALGLFLIIWNSNLKLTNMIITSITSMFIHYSIFPIILLMALFEKIRNNKYIISLILTFIVLSLIVSYIFPFPKYILPESMPYYERLTMSFYPWSNQTTPNMEGKFIIRYYLIGLIPVLIILMKLIYNKLYFFEEKRNYNLILSCSFPLILAASIPNANRLSYYFIFICLLYGPNIGFQLLKLFVKPKTSYNFTLLLVILGHIIIYFYFYEKELFY